MKKRVLFAISCWSLVFVTYAQHPTIQAIINDVNLDTLMFRTEEVSGFRSVTVGGVEDTILSRNKFQPGNELCFQYAKEKFISWGYQVDSQTFAGTTGKNLWAIKPGYLYPNEEVIICAHYDGMPGGTIAPAADDDGSGVAAVLEAARILAPYTFEYTILFALWDEEEYGLAGSAAYANNANSNNDTIRAVINMDAISHDSDNDSVARVHVRPPGNSEEIGDTVVAMNNDYNLGIDLLLINPGATYSDHQSFWQRNYGAVLIIQDWEGDPNPHYHLVSDSITYIRPDYFKKLTQLSIASTAAIAVPLDTTTLGLNSHETDPFLRVYPNPTTDVVNIKWQHNYTNLTVTDMLGREVVSIPLADQVKFQQFDLTEFGSGLYTITLSDGIRFVRYKIMRS